MKLPYVCTICVFVYVYNNKLIYVLNTNKITIKTIAFPKTHFEVIVK